MNDARMFSTDQQRGQAIMLRRLLLRLENGAGEDRILGADILDAFAAPTEIGDVTGCIDCAWYLASYLKQPAGAVADMATREMSARIARGFKSVNTLAPADLARGITLILLRVELAKLERAPA